MKTKRLAVCAMLAAMCAVLGYISIDLGAIKISFESLPVLLSGELFGPIWGLAVGTVGTLLSQLRYGFDPTTILWMLPFMVCGFVTGLISKKHKFEMDRKQEICMISAGELIVTVLNTVALFFYPIIAMHASAVESVADLFTWVQLPRLALCIAKIVVYALIFPPICRAVRKFVK